MANVFFVSHILLLFQLPKHSQNKSAAYEKLGKFYTELGTVPKLMHEYNEWTKIVLFLIRCDEVCNKIEPALLLIEWKIVEGLTRENGKSDVRTRSFWRDG